MVTRVLLFFVAALCCVLLVDAGSAQAWVDFDFGKENPNAYQPTSLTQTNADDYGDGITTSPLLFGNKVKLVNVHLENGRTDLFSNESPRPATGRKYVVRFVSSDSLLSFTSPTLSFALDYVNSTDDWNITGSYDVVVYAQNPSATPWVGPGGVSFEDEVAAGVGPTGQPPRTSYPWSVLVSCQDADASDCFSDFCNTYSGELNITEYGYCWQKIYTDSSTSDRPPIVVTTRSLGLWTPEFDSSAPIKASFYSPFSGNWPGASTEVYPNQATSALVMCLPLESGGVFPVIPGTPSDSRTLRFYPGIQNIGGSITVDVWKILLYYQNGSAVNFAINQLPFQFTSQVLSKDSPSFSFQATNVPGGPDVSTYRVYFRAVESSATVITPSNSSQNSSEGSWGSGAYVVPYLDIVVKDVGIQFENFPPGASGGVVQIPITPAPPAETYILTIDLSPSALGVQSIALPFTVTPAGAIQFYVGGSALDPTVGFVFSGYQRVIAFGVATQTTPVGGVTLTFGTPVVTGGVGLSGLQFAVPGSFNLGFSAGGGGGSSSTLTSTATAPGSTSATSPADSSASTPASSTSPAGSQQSTQSAAMSAANAFTLAAACIALLAVVLLA